jgi:hypothetical protein
MLATRRTCTRWCLALAVNCAASGGRLATPLTRQHSASHRLQALDTECPYGVRNWGEGFKLSGFWGVEGVRDRFAVEAAATDEVIPYYWNS